MANSLVGAQGQLFVLAVLSQVGKVCCHQVTTASQIPKQKTSPRPWSLPHLHVYPEHRQQPTSSLQAVSLPLCKEHRGIPRAWRVNVPAKNNVCKQGSGLALNLLGHGTSWSLSPDPLCWPPTRSAAVARTSISTSLLVQLLEGVGSCGKTEVPEIGSACLCESQSTASLARASPHLCSSSGQLRTRSRAGPRRFPEKDTGTRVISKGRRSVTCCASTPSRAFSWLVFSFAVYLGFCFPSVFN